MAGDLVRALFAGVAVAAAALTSDGHEGRACTVSGPEPLRPADRARILGEVTCRIWPNGWWCHAVRPPGVKWTLSIRTRDGGSGVAISSIHTWPLNHSRGPGRVSARYVTEATGNG
jgi:hypothetical protein